MLVQTFGDHQIARAAVRELVEVGFRESQIAISQDDINQGCTVVAVKAGIRADIATCVLSRFNETESLSFVA